MPEQLPIHEVVAFNSAVSSENKIHDDEVAARFGFAGGLVPGVDVYAYLCRPAIERWGLDFCSSSRTSARFDLPVLDGELVRIEAAIDDEGTLRATATSGTAAAGPDGPAATLEATLDQMPPEVPATSVAPLPAERPPASPETLATGTALGSFSVACDAEGLAGYLALVRDEASPVIGLGVVHPGWLLRHANHILGQNVLLGPWMHVGSVVWHQRPVEIGEEISVQGYVHDHHEHKGHRFVVLSVAMYGADGGVSCTVEHTAIYEPRQVRELAG